MFAASCALFWDLERARVDLVIDNVWDQVRANVGRVRMPEPGIVPDVNDEFGDTFILLAAVFYAGVSGAVALAAALVVAVFAVIVVLMAAISGNVADLASVTFLLFFVALPVANALLDWPSWCKFEN